MHTLTVDQATGFSFYFYFGDLPQPHLLRAGAAALALK
jgi:hypothetical protein